MTLIRGCIHICSAAWVIAWLGVITACAYGAFREHEQPTIEDGNSVFAIVIVSFVALLAAGIGAIVYRRVGLSHLAGKNQ